MVARSDFLIEPDLAATEDCRVGFLSIIGNPTLILVPKMDPLEIMFSFISM
jgi:hypothetical protein